MRENYQVALTEMATQQGLSETRLLELALAHYQATLCYAREGYFPQYRNMAGELHPLDEIAGCMGDD